MPAMTGGMRRPRASTETTTRTRTAYPISGRGPARKPSGTCRPFHGLDVSGIQRSALPEGHVIGICDEHSDNRSGAGSCGSTARLSPESPAATADTRRDWRSRPRHRDAAQPPLPGREQRDSQHGELWFHQRGQDHHDRDEAPTAVGAAPPERPARSAPRTPPSCPDRLLSTPEWPRRPTPRTPPPAPDRARPAPPRPRE